MSAWSSTRGTWERGAISRRRNEPAANGRGEAAGGIVAYDVDSALRQAVFALGGRLYHLDLETGTSRAVVSAEAVFDPRLDPTGRRVAYVSGAALRVTELDADDDRALADEPESPDVSWGSAEFVAAEELGRMRGFWWGPDGQRVVAARVDVGPVPTWYISSPIDPASPPTPIRYPGAGSQNAVVDLAIVGLDGARVPVEWRRGEWEYLVSASWAPRDRITLFVLTRDQRTAAVLEIDPDTAGVEEVARWSDPCWVDIVPGAPAWLDERLLLVVDDAATDTRRLTIDGEFATPPGLQVRSIAMAGSGGIVLEVSSDPTETHVMVLDAEGALWPATRAPGVHRAWAAADTIVVATRTMEHDGVQMRINRQGIEVGVLTDHSAIPLVRPMVAFAEVGARGLRAGVLFPTDAPVDRRFPVLLDPYGGPHHARVVRSRSAWLSSQWFADQGFAVVVIDNRGTPGRGPAFEREVHLDLAGPVLDDQVDALHRVGRAVPPARSRTGGDTGLVVRGFPGRPGGDSSARHLQGSRRRCSGDGLPALRHRVHRAVSRAPGVGARCLCPVRPDRRRGRPHPPAHVDPWPGR